MLPCVLVIHGGLFFLRWVANEQSVNSFTTKNQRANEPARRLDQPWLATASQGAF